MDQRMATMTVSAERVRLFLEGFIANGHDPASLLKQHGFNPLLLTNPGIRSSVLKFVKLTDTVKRFLQDETFGVLSRPQKVGTYPWIARACISANTIGESLEMWSNGLDFADNAMRSSSHFEGGVGVLSIQFNRRKGVSSDYVMASAFWLAHRFHCWLSNEFLPIIRVEFRHSEPSYVEDYRYIFGGAPVIFNASRNAICFGQSNLELPNVRSLRDFEEISNDFYLYLIGLAPQGVSTSVKVRLWLETRYRNWASDAGMETLASNWLLSTQTLRRRLANEGTTFKAIKEEVRRDLAIAMIEQQRDSVEEIAFKLGYSEASPFIRAFGKWTGMTPLVYRKLHASAREIAPD